MSSIWALVFHFFASFAMSLSNFRSVLQIQFGSRYPLRWYISYMSCASGAFIREPNVHVYLAAAVYVVCTLYTVCSTFTRSIYLSTYMRSCCICCVCCVYKDEYSFRIGEGIKQSEENEKRTQSTNSNNNNNVIVRRNIECRCMKQFHYTCVWTVWRQSRRKEPNRPQQRRICCTVYVYWIYQREFILAFSLSPTLFSFHFLFLVHSIPRKLRENIHSTFWCGWFCIFI